MKIIDFGFSTQFPHETKICVFYEALSFMPPEIVSRKEYYRPPADIWVLRMLLFSYCVAFRYVNNLELYRKIQRGHFIVPSFICRNTKNLIVKML